MEIMWPTESVLVSATALIDRGVEGSLWMSTTTTDEVAD